jgi:hypothetical protein
MSTQVKPGFMLSVIPFSGFYYIAHDDALDRALEQCFSADSGDPYPGLVSRAFDLVQWDKVKARYAAEYAEAFAKEFGIVGAEFESMTSPRFYNFETDRVFMLIPLGEVARMHSETPRETLAQVAAEMFTSRSGFISFYSPDVSDWGDLCEWDHNQVYALVSAFVLHRRDGEEFDQWAELALVEDLSSNGNLDNWLFEHADTAAMNRLGRVCDYLRQREDRANRVGV